MVAEVAISKRLHDCYAFSSKPIEAFYFCVFDTTGELIAAQSISLFSTFLLVCLCPLA